MNRVNGSALLFRLLAQPTLALFWFHNKKHVEGEERNVPTHAVMPMELVSEVSVQGGCITPKALGKLLHMARLRGWQPFRVSNQWPEDYSYRNA